MYLIIGFSIMPIVCLKYTFLAFRKHASIISKDQEWENERLTAWVIKLDEEVWSRMKKTEQNEELKGEALSKICEEPEESFEERIVCHNIKKETAGRNLEQLKDDIDKEIGTESDSLVQ